MSDATIVQDRSRGTVSSLVQLSGNSYFGNDDDCGTRHIERVLVDISSVHRRISSAASKNGTRLSRPWVTVGACKQDRSNAVLGLIFPAFSFPVLSENIDDDSAPEFDSTAPEFSSHSGEACFLVENYPEAAEIRETPVQKDKRAIQVFGSN
ncbi:hypothetical protein K3495_g9872 [Podosphaera aphanis]|nr:hypothetical protein K3495_g9872 [Podosphaera aphanis]